MKFTSWIIIVVSVLIAGHGLLITPSVFAHTSSVVGLTITDTHVQTPFDKVPRLCNLQAPTHISATSGAWSNPATWNTGSVPGASARVHIAAGTTVTYDVASENVVACIEVRDTGHLTFATNQNTKLVLDDGLYVLPGSGGGGRLTIGTQAAPINANNRAEIIFADTPLKTGTPSSPGPDPQQYGKILAVWGEISMHGGVKNSTFERVADQLTAGQTSITLHKAVSGWRAGDTIFIPESRFAERDDTLLGSGGLNHEERTLASVSADGKTLTFTEPLQFAHPCAENNDRTRARVTNVDPSNPLFNEPLCPHAVNLTRNILFASANPSGTRGHTLMLHRAVVDVRYVEFREMDRTHANILNNSTFDASGNLTHVGTNQIGRYSLHLHHLYGPTNPSNTGYQYQAIGNSFNGSLKWAMTVHDTSFGLIKDNVFVKGEGAPLATETGEEFENVIEHNFVGEIRKSATSVDKINLPSVIDGYSGALGFGLWFGGPFNHIRDNVVTGARSSFYALWPPAKRGSVKVPKFRGADTTVAGQFDTRIIPDSNFTEFARNEAYGAWAPNQIEVIDLWDIGRKIPEVNVSSGVWPAFANKVGKPEAEAITIDQQISWHTGKFSNNYPGSGYEIYNKVLIRGAHGTGAKQDGPGIENNGAGLETKVIDADIEGNRAGIHNAEFGYLMEVIGGRIASSVADILDGGNGTHSFGTHTVVRNVLMPGNPRRHNSAPSTPTVEGKVEVPGLNLHTFHIFDFNQRPGDNLQIFYPEQAADTVIVGGPVNAANFISSTHPCAGLTNRQCWEQHGQAFFGQVASCATNDRSSELLVNITKAGSPTRQGFVCPLVTPAVSNVQTTAAETNTAMTVGPVGYWKFDEGTGQTAADSAGTSPLLITPTTKGDIKWTTDTPSTSFSNPSALAGRQSDTSLLINNSYSNRDTGYTYSFWLKGPSGGTAEVLFDTYYSNLNFFFRRSSDKLNVHLRSTSGSSTVIPILDQTSQATVFDNQWHHITWTDQDGRGRLYVDGQLDAANFSYPTYDRSGQPVGTLRTGPTLRLLHAAVGNMDDLRAYNRVLAPHEVADLAAGRQGDVTQTLAAVQGITWETPASQFARYYVQYGLDTSYTHRTAKTTKKSHTLTGLLPSTTYHYRVCGELPMADGELTGCSPDATFASASTGSAPPRLIVTQPAAGSTFTSTTVDVHYTATGDLAAAGADHIHFQLDSEPEVRGISLTGGVHTFQNVAAGSHTITGYLARADHSKVDGTDISVSFTTTAPEPEPAPNTAPTITLPNNQTSFSVEIGQLLSIPITATDVDGDEITISIPDLSTLLPGAVLE